MRKDKNGKPWYRGNLHTHTTRTDGKRSPEDVIALYRADGYDFLALTDHWLYEATAETADFVLLSGCEYNIGLDPVYGIYHLVGIGMSHEPDLNRATARSAQEIIQAINAAGGLAILAHPAWSLNTPAQILPLRGLGGIEIFNSVSDLPHNARPDASLIVDQLACRGHILPCFACDDSHFYDGEETRSYIWVQSDSLTAADLLAALRRGDFFASQGPWVDVIRKGDFLEIYCSPARHIVCYSGAVWSANRVFSGSDLTEARYPIAADDQFVRVEVIDEAGRKAWTTPCRLDRQGGCAT